MTRKRGIREQRGFNMIELMLALTLVAIASLTLVALSFTAVSARQKAENISDAMLVAEEQLTLAVRNIEAMPQANHSAFWDAPLTAPFAEGTIQIGESEYNFRVLANDINTGTAAPNRLRKLDITVWWWSENPGEGRVGSGQLTYSASRLVREVTNDT